jgi:hypothetical protein
LPKEKQVVGQGATPVVLRDSCHNVAISESPDP